MLKHFACLLLVALAVCAQESVEFCNGENCGESSCDGRGCNYCAGEKCCSSSSCNACINDCKSGCSSRSCSMSCFDSCQTAPVGKCCDSAPHCQTPCREQRREECSYRSCDRRSSGSASNKADVVTNIDIDNRIDNVNEIHIPINVTSVNINNVHSGQSQDAASQCAGENCSVVPQRPIYVPRPYPVYVRERVPQPYPVPQLIPVPQHIPVPQPMPVQSRCAGAGCQVGCAAGGCAMPCGGGGCEAPCPGGLCPWGRK